MAKVTRTAESKSQTAATKAERKAWWYAEEVAGYRGFRAEVTVNEYPAEYYRDGSVMMPARTHAHVSIYDESLFGDVLSCGWVTDADTDGKKGRTRCLSGNRIRGGTLRRKVSVRIKNESCFAREVSFLHYTAEVRDELAQDRETYGDDGARVLHTIQLDSTYRDADGNERKRVIGRAEIAVKTGLPLATVTREAEKLAKAGAVQRDRYSDGKVYYFARKAN